MKILKTYQELLENYKLSDLSVGDYLILKSPEHIPGFSKNQYTVSEYFFSHNIGTITKIEGGDIYVKFHNAPTQISRYLFNENNEITAELSDILYQDSDVDSLWKTLDLIKIKNKYKI